MTQVLHVDPERPDEQTIARAAACLRAGGLVAFPTETVYGLGVHALDRTAVRRLFEAKGRPATDPLIVHIASADALATLTTTVPDAAHALGVRFWPGPLTMVVPRSPVVPDEVTAGLATVAIRVPGHPVAHALILAADVPIAAPSANLFSRPSPTRAAHVMEDLDGRIDLVIDGGQTTIGVESTVIDLTGTTPLVLRPGAVTLEMIREVLPDARTADPGEARHTEHGGLPSPGLLEKHYSPRAELTLFEGSAATALGSLIDAARAARARGRIVGVLAADEDQAALAALRESDSGVLLRTLGPHAVHSAAAARLYASLRELDAAGAEVILVRGFFEGSGLAVALRDRLRRAAAGRIIRS